MFKINLSIIDLPDGDKLLQQAKETYAMYLAKIGEEYTNESKAATYGEYGKQYKNRTHNLRNANAYRIYIDGKPFIESEMRPETNILFQEKMIPEGVQLIVGNGMNYATYVERREYNVVSSGFALVIRMIEELKNKEININDLKVSL